MSLKEETEALRRIPLFQNLDPAKLKLLAFMSQRLTFEHGQAVFAQGDAGDAAYIVLEGDAVVSIETPNARIDIAKLARNDIVGEIAILCDVPRTAHVTATGDKPLVCLKIEKNDFIGMLNEFPNMAVEVMRELARRIVNTNQKLRQAVAANG